MRIDYDAAGNVRARAKRLQIAFPLPALGTSPTE